MALRPFDKLTLRQAQGERRGFTGEGAEGTEGGEWIPAFAGMTVVGVRNLTVSVLAKTWVTVLLLVVAMVVTPL